VDQLNKANSLVNTNNAKLNELLAGTGPEEIAQARARVHEQEAALINAKLLFEKNKKGYPVGVVSKQDYDNSKKQLEATMEQLASAQSTLLEAVNGPRKEDIQAAQANLQCGENNVGILSQLQKMLKKQMNTKELYLFL
jgi:HlyD family secretion protein